jgi:IclR family acetate operon transcriptional repressor
MATQIEHLPDTAGAVSRVITVLGLLAEDPDEGLSIRKTAERAGISRSAVHRILSQLAQCGVARARSDGVYAAGPVFYELATRLISGSTLLESADRLMQQLVRDVGETVCLTQLVPAEQRLVFVHVVECDKPVKYVVQVGTTAPLHAGAAGKAVLAWLPDGVLGKLDLPSITPSTPTDRAALAAELAVVRDRGYATSLGERFTEAVGIAAPVFTDGVVTGSMSVTVPRSRYSDDQLPVLSGLVAAAAEEFSRQHRGPRTMPAVEAHK